MERKIQPENGKRKTTKGKTKDPKRSREEQQEEPRKPKGKKAKRQKKGKTKSKMILHRVDETKGFRGWGR